MSDDERLSSSAYRFNGRCQKVVVRHEVENARLEVAVAIPSDEHPDRRQLTITAFDGDRPMLTEIVDLTELWERLATD